LIEAGLKLVRGEENLKRIGVEGFADVATAQVRVERVAGLGERVGVPDA
jgi:hypothetical protein